MIKLRVEISKPKLKKLRPREIDEAAQILLDDLKETVPYESGKLYNGLRKRKTAKGVELYIQGKRNNEVAGYLINGTDDHFVAPKNKKALHWVEGGKDMYSTGHVVSGIRKGYWKFKPRARALQQFARRINLAVKSK